MKGRGVGPAGWPGSTGTAAGEGRGWARGCPEGQLGRRGVRHKGHVKQG